jgi:hypothetical protein
MSDGRHQYFNDPAVGRLMGSLLALTGELFVVKAELEVLKKALQSQGVVAENNLEEASSSEEVQEFLVRERTAYAEHVFGPIRTPDQAMEEHWQLYGPGPDPDAAGDPATANQQDLASSRVSS